MKILYRVSFWWALKNEENGSYFTTIEAANRCAEILIKNNRQHVAIEALKY